MKDIRYKPLFLEAHADERLCWTVEDVLTDWRPETDSGRLKRFASEQAAQVLADQKNRAGGYRTIGLTLSVQRIVAIAQAGQRLVRAHINRRDAAAETAFHFEPSGKSAPLLASEQAVEMGLLVPLADGLFGSEIAQSYIHPEAAQ